MFIIIKNFALHSECGIRDKEAILCALKLRHQLGDKVTIVTDLAVESHIHLLDTHPHSSKLTFELINRYILNSGPLDFH